MDNRIERLVKVLVAILLIACIAGCSPGQITDLGADVVTQTPEENATTTPELLRESVFDNVTNISFYTNREADYGAYWIKTIEEYNNLRLDKEYDEDFFKDKALLVIKAEWESGTPTVTLNPNPVIEGNILYPVINVHMEGNAFDCAYMTSLMTAEVDKRYAEMLIGEIKFTFSGNYFDDKDNRIDNFYHSEDKER